MGDCGAKAEQGRAGGSVSPTGLGFTIVGLGDGAIYSCGRQLSVFALYSIDHVSPKNVGLRRQKPRHGKNYLWAACESLA